MKASREEIDQSIKEAFNMNRQESNERTERKSLTYYFTQRMQPFNGASVPR